MASLDSSCSFAGNTDMYGLGIRIGFYLQWYGEIIGEWIAEEEVPGIRYSNSFFIFATFLALIIQTEKNNLKPVEVYIILLLTFGGYLYFVPLYLWRLATGHRARLDPSRWPRVKNGEVFSYLNHGLVVTVASFEIWFWLKKIKDVGTDGCQEYGFLFTKLRLNEKGFIITNLLFYFFLVVCCASSILVLIAKRFRIVDFEDEKGLTRRQALPLQRIRTGVNIIIASTVVTATELTIKWNHIESVSDLQSAGQLIPTVIGVGIVVRVLYVGWRRWRGSSKEPRNGDDRDPSGTDSKPGFTWTEKELHPPHRRRRRRRSRHRRPEVEEFGEMKIQTTPGIYSDAVRPTDPGTFGGPVPGTRRPRKPERTEQNDWGHDKGGPMVVNAAVVTPAERGRFGFVPAQNPTTAM